MRIQSISVNTQWSIPNSFKNDHFGDMKNPEVATSILFVGGVDTLSKIWPIYTVWQKP